MKISFLFFFLLWSLSSKAQNPLIKLWDYRYGGTIYDQVFTFQQTKDAGYLLGGYSGSDIGGDKTQDAVGERDYWIVKLDSLGIKQWDKDFGGTANEFLYSLQQTSDGGFILGGYSESGIGGDKTEDTVGGNDYWIIKIDSLGNKQWDKDFGGTMVDFLYSVEQTSDKGYIVGGASASGVGGNKTQGTWGSFDYWILKLDSLGNKEWDKDFGGTDSEYLFSLHQSNDGGYILGGISASGISGDKTQPNLGSFDYWILKTDSLGNKQWDRTFGGYIDDRLYSLQQTHDEGYILGGYSNSGIGGDKTQSTWGSYDYWILKIDSLGNKQWDKDIGGTDNEVTFGNVTQTFDKGYLLAGASYSNAGGDKTENNIGPYQSWVVKTDSLGNKEWDKTLLVGAATEKGLAIQTTDGCYTMVNFNNSFVGGDKTQDRWGGDDYWIIRFCDSTFFFPNASLIALQHLCPGSCVSFQNLSLHAISYLWSFPGGTPDTSSDINPTNICYPNPGTYDVQLIATNSNGSDTLLLANYITVYPSPAPQAIMQIGDTLFANAGSAAYQWYFNGSIINGATDYFYVAAQSGDYNVVATDLNGCEVEAVINNVIASSKFAVPGLQFAIYPNPVFDNFIIHQNGTSNVTNETDVEIIIYNLMGEKVNLPFDQSQWTVDCRTLPSGIYYIEVNQQEKIFRAKFVKQ